jgi:acyl-coenzyme A thioesterase 9
LLKFINNSSKYKRRIVHILPKLNCHHSDKVAAMLAPARRIALSSCKAASPRTVIFSEQAARCIKPAHVAKRHFHKTPANAFYKALWQSMRVKMPWVDALAQSRQQAGQTTVEDGKAVKPDLTPRRMSDSYFAAVR